MTHIFFDSARIFQLEEEFRTAGADFVGTQETRAKHMFRRSLEHYHIVGGPSDDTSLGCALWLKKEIYLDSDDTCIKIAIHNITIAHADKRFIYVCLRTPRASFDFLVIHAPYISVESE